MAFNYAQQKRPGGLLGGYASGVEQRQKQTNRDLVNEGLAISNAKSNAEFMDYLDERDARLAEYQERKAQANMVTELTPDQQAAQQAQYEAQEETSRLQKETAQKERDVVDEKAQLQKAQMQKQWYDLDKSYTDDDRAYVAEASRTFSQAVEQGGVDPAEAYANVYHNLVQAHPLSRRPGGAQAVAQKFAQMGVTPDFTPQAGRALEMMGNQAIDSVAQSRKKDLLLMEWGFRVEKAKVEAGTKGKPTDRSFKRPTDDHINSLGRELESLVPEFGDVSGTFDSEQGYTKDKRAVASAIANASAKAITNLKVGDDATPYEYEVALAALLSARPDRYLTKDTLGLTSYGGGRDFNAAVFASDADKIITLISNYREISAAGGGGRVTPLQAWQLNSQQWTSLIPK